MSWKVSTMCSGFRPTSTSTWSNSPKREDRVKVLGVDPGTAATGYGVVVGRGVADALLLECGAIRTNASEELSARLEVIYRGVNEVIDRHQPDCVSLESAFFSRNARTSLVLGHARGVIMLAARLRGIRIFEYPPAEIKKAVAGSGIATKEQVQFMVAKLLRLKHPPEPDDAADGVAAALAHLEGARLASALVRGALGDAPIELIERST
jgi:crossover junction endodeoxyribonuclease RuvC